MLTGIFLKLTSSHQYVIKVVPQIVRAIAYFERKVHFPTTEHAIFDEAGSNVLGDSSKYLIRQMSVGRHVPFVVAQLETRLQVIAHFDTVEHEIVAHRSVGRQSDAGVASVEIGGAGRG